MSTIIGRQPPNRRATLMCLVVAQVHCGPPPSPDHDSGAVFRVPGSAFNRARDLAEVRHGSEAFHRRLGIFDIHRAVA